MNQEYIQKVVSALKRKKLSKDNLFRLKVKLCSQYNVKKVPTDIEILLNTDPKDLLVIQRQLLTKPTRTISGVAIIAVMSPPYPCPHGRCTFCPGGINSFFGNVPQSYTGKEPSTRRAIRNHYDPYLITMNRLEQYTVTGHVPEKVEVILQGGTFPFYPADYQANAIRDIFRALNDFSDMFFGKNGFDIAEFKKFFELPGDIGDNSRLLSIHKKLLQLKENPSSLEYEQKRNESSKIRCVALCIETKPDYGKLKHGNELLNLGCTRVELGIQTIYDDVLRDVNRGHTIQDSVESTKILKDLGFKITYHMMPGLPGVSKEMDINSLKEIFRNPDYRPDMLKLYPCMVMPGTRLYADWKKGSFNPITTKEAAEIIAEFKRNVPSYCRIVRIQRDIPTYATASGVDRTNLRQYVEKVAKEKGVKCRCIRCREAGHALERDKSLKLGKIGINVEEYEASGGKEFFISAEEKSNDILFGYARLRFPGQFLRKEITPKSALIRELHIYSPAVSLGKKSKNSFQHRGLGKKLLKTAEQLAKKNRKDKVVVISGIGAREYFRKLGYKKEGPYMVKKL